MPTKLSQEDIVTIRVLKSKDQKNTENTHDRHQRAAITEYFHFSPLRGGWGIITQMGGADRPGSSG